jgi:rubrerythrin
MIAQTARTNNGVVTDDEATVQAAVELLTSKKAPTAQRWACEVCGMLHTGSRPTSCESCGATTSFTHEFYSPRTLNSRW